MGGVNQSGVSLAFKAQSTLQSAVQYKQTTANTAHTLCRSYSCSRFARGVAWHGPAVADGAICDVTFTSDLFDYPVPARFSPIIVTQTLI